MFRACTVTVLVDCTVAVFVVCVLVVLDGPAILCNRFCKFCLNKSPGVVVVVVAVLI